MSLKLIPPRQGRSKNYTIRGTVRGVPIDETTGTADRDRAEAIRIKRENELLDESVFGKRASRAFSEAALGYAQQLKNEGASLTQIEAVIGRIRKDGNVTRSLVDDFGAMLVDRIDQDVVDKVIARRFGTDYNPATVLRNFLTPLIAVLNYAHRRKWCDAPTLERPEQRKGAARQARALPYDEADRVLEASSRHIYELALFLMMSGARMSEALNLDWADVRLSDRWAVLRKTKRNGEDRGIPLHPQLVTMLANMRHRTGKVFLTHKGQPYAEKISAGGQIKTAWRATLRRAEVEYIRPHDLRHTFATWLMSLGVVREVRERIMGHQSQEMAGRYAHVADPLMIEAVTRLEMRAAMAPEAPAILPARRKKMARA